MTKVKVVAKKDFIETIATSSSPLSALSELIWNGLDAGSEIVNVFIRKNDADGIESIIVEDFGDGINRTEVETLFGSLGDSWKKTKEKVAGRALHGKNGRGRFKAFALGSHVEWVTNYKLGGVTRRFSITGEVNSLDDFEVSAEENLDSATGTRVTISNPHKNYKSLLNNEVISNLSKIFATYLTEYPQVKIYFDGEVIDPKAAQEGIFNYNLPEFRALDGTSFNVQLTIIEWKIDSDRSVHLCDANGISLHDAQLQQRIRAPGFNFTIYLKSQFFRDLDKAGVLALGELNSDIKSVIDCACAEAKSHFQARIAQQKSAIVDDWKKSMIYPYTDDHDIGPVEAAERQVFDIIAVNVQTHLPSFQKSDVTSKKFTFRLLSQAIKQNPEAVQTILNEVLNLNADTQNDLAKLLKKTSLSSIISSARTVANRLDFLNGLEELIFDKESKKKLLERDQLHKILEKEPWVFDDEFALSSSEERLEDVLKKHLSILGDRKDEDENAIVDVGEGKSGRIDLMLSRVIKPRSNEYDYLVVELKRPSQKIDANVLTQIEKYAIAVANDERFQGVKARWTFIAVSNELDEFVKRRANQRGKPPGMAFDDGDLNITVWAKNWSDIINDARGKLAFVNANLDYDADKESAKSYLHAAHSKFIPQVPTFANEEAESDYSNETC